MAFSSKMSNTKDASQSVYCPVQEGKVMQYATSAAMPVLDPETVALTKRNSETSPVDIQHSEGEGATDASAAQLPVMLSEAVAKTTLDKKHTTPADMLPPDLTSPSDGSSSPAAESTFFSEPENHSVGSQSTRDQKVEALSNIAHETDTNSETNSKDENLSTKCNGVHSSQENSLCDNNECEKLLGATSDEIRDASIRKRDDVLDEDSSPALNPFVHRIHFRFPYDYIKVALLTIVIVPIRVFLIASSIVLAYIVSSIGLYGLTPNKLTEKPFSGWKRPTQEVVRWWVRQVFVACGLQRLSIVGHRASSSEAPILVVAPHSSFFDSMVAVATSPPPSVVAKAETCHLPVAGKFISFTQPVFVWRDDSNSRQQTVNEIKKRVASKQGWPQMMLFPEGTCTNRSCLITFKAGAFYPGVPVQPVVIRYFNSMDTTTWTWDGPSALKLIWLTMAQFHNFAELEYLPVYYPSEEEKNDAHLYAANVRSVMAKALGVPVVDYSYDDCRVMNQAKLNKLPPHIGLIEFQKLRRAFGFTLKEVEKCMSSQFAQMADRDGVLRLPGLARYLHLPHSEPTLVHLFNLLDTGHRGKVTFRQYLLSYWEVVKPVVTEELAHHTFSLLDVEGEGKVSLSGLAKALDSMFELTEEESEAIFNEIDVKENNFITKDDFYAHCQHKGEYVWLLLRYQESVRSGARKESGYRRTLDVPSKAKSE